MPRFKTIFLDIDGVFNSLDYFEQKKGKHEARPFPESTLDVTKITRFNRAIKETKAIVVITSLMRKGRKIDEIEELLRRNGAEFRVLDFTPVLESRRRGQEIEEWMKENPFVGNFVIVDDESSDMEHFSDKLVKTTTKRGLEECHIDEIISRLNNAK